MKHTGSQDPMGMSSVNNSMMFQILVIAMKTCLGQSS